MARRTVAVAAALLFAAFCGPASAGVVINVGQSGPNVVVTGMGTLNLTDLTFDETIPNDIAQIVPLFALINLGPVSAATTSYHGISGPDAFSPLRLSTPASSGSGDMFGVIGASDLIVVPSGYVSGTSLSGTSTYDNSTIAMLGLSAGTSYTYTWGTGVNADSLTVNIAVVPEPSSLLMGSVATLAGLGTWARRRRS
jgi:hypothetical protein